MSIKEEQYEKTNRAAEGLGDVLNDLHDGLITLDEAIAKAKDYIVASEERSQILFFKKFMDEYFWLYTTEPEQETAFSGLLEVIRGEFRYLKTGIPPLFTRKELLKTVPEKTFRLKGSMYFYGRSPVSFSPREREACDYFMSKADHIASSSEIAALIFGDSLDTAMVSDFIYKLNDKVGPTANDHKLIEQVSKRPTIYKLYTTAAEYPVKN